MYRLWFHALQESRVNDRYLPPPSRNSLEIGEWRGLLEGRTVMPRGLLLRLSLPTVMEIGGCDRSHQIQ